MFEQFTDECMGVYDAANRIAADCGNETLGVEHLLAAILQENSAGRSVLMRLRVDIDEMASAVREKFVEEELMQMGAGSKTA